MEHLDVLQVVNMMLSVLDYLGLIPVLAALIIGLGAIALIQRVTDKG